MHFGLPSTFTGGTDESVACAAGAMKRSARTPPATASGALNACVFMCVLPLGFGVCGSAGEARGDRALRAASECQRQLACFCPARGRELHLRDDLVPPESVPARTDLERVALPALAQRLDLLAVDRERHPRDAPARHARPERLLDTAAGAAQRGPPGRHGLRQHVASSAPGT